MLNKDMIMSSIYHHLIGKGKRELLKNSEDAVLKLTADSITFTATLHRGEVLTVALDYPEDITLSADESFDIGCAFKHIVDKAIHHIKANNSHGSSYAYH